MKPSAFISFSLLPPPPPSSTLFPYTTLFRSVRALLRSAAAERPVLVLIDDVPWIDRESAMILGFRSEEHTSELQSRFDLVCRLLLEKKNKSVDAFRIAAQRRHGAISSTGHAV